MLRERKPLRYMRPPNDKQKFLDELEEVPIVSVACRRTGISKATIYRWRDEDARFAKLMTKAIERGRQSITDLAEGQTVVLMKKGDFRAIKYWLDNNERRYIKPRKAISPPPREIHTVNVHVVGADGKPITVNHSDSKEEKPKPPPLVVLKKPPTE